MNIQIFGKQKCFDTRKAERYFKERKIKYQLIDLPRYGMSKGEFPVSYTHLGTSGTCSKASRWAPSIWA